MTDFLSELNLLMERLALEPDVSATALVGDGASTYLVLSDRPDRYIGQDDWAAGFEATLGPSEERGTLAARICRLAGVELTFLFGDTSWATKSATPEDLNVVGELFEIHDPRGLIRKLRTEKGKQRPTFASNDEIAKYGNVSSDFFRIIGLDEAVFISDASTLRTWCEASGLSLELANARIHDVYGVDVSDLDGGRLIDVFERIQRGEYYRKWKAQH